MSARNAIWVWIRRITNKKSRPIMGGIFFLLKRRFTPQTSL
nr:MAG TPA: phospho-N-acetylmuramoyl-pentapeptide-transferase [Caudoviricetes sp.]